ncbi:TPA: hypothetical protein QDB11_000531 [Burkholderia vietnamiensis]|uniref:hypothetical protein n=1 Tax=Burkholderia vietnamiensis TaxID=60552 RepID=UPI0026566B63|nr:hypothetical protein [Burkholderia vietnamiensis]MDN8111304.1 hypothetical protein [Burkholderia vietnamiensis]HDR9135925.1 hypothetical protein [Burkholderia vietnamiensis]
MAKFDLTRDALLHMVPTVAKLFDDDAEFSEKSATDGVPKVLIVRNPLGNGTPYLSIRFPGDLLDRYDALSGADRAKFEMRLAHELLEQKPKLEGAFRSGNLKPEDPFVVEFDDSLFDGI